MNVETQSHGSAAEFSAAGVEKGRSIRVRACMTLTFCRRGINQRSKWWWVSSEEGINQKGRDEEGRGERKKI
jgi:hypothetical protein